jgi:hypothetical protein
VRVRTTVLAKQVEQLALTYALRNTCNAIDMWTHITASDFLVVARLQRCTICVRHPR